MTKRALISGITGQDGHRLRRSIYHPMEQVDQVHMSTVAPMGPGIRVGARVEMKGHV